MESKKYRGHWATIPSGVLKYWEACVKTILPSQIKNHMVYVPRSKLSNRYSCVDTLPQWNTLIDGTRDNCVSFEKYLTYPGFAECFGPGLISQGAGHQRLYIRLQGEFHELLGTMVNAHGNRNICLFGLIILIANVSPKYLPWFGPARYSEMFPYQK